MMLINVRHAFVRAASGRYMSACKKEKGLILDEFVANSGLSRKHALRLLLRPSEARGRLTRKRSRKYGEPEQLALKRLWPVSGYVSAERFVAGLSDLMAACGRHGEWVPEDAVKQKLLQMSASTCGRLLKPFRRTFPKKTISMTRRGEYLKSQIAVRLGTEWDDAIPGFIEGDTVAHCGGSAEGPFHCTLTLTDIALGWTELVALAGKGRIETLAGIELAARRMPVPIRGLDFDNGSEFINHHVAHFCSKHEIKLTRGRPYVKNDGCHVEQKNSAVVRRHVGHDRLDSPEQLCLLKELYSVLRLLVNYFEPSTKLQKTKTEDGKSRKTYDKPMTPYRRVLESEHVCGEVKDRLNAQFLTLNPVALRNRLRLIKKDLIHPDLVRFLDDLTE